MRTLEEERMRICVVVGTLRHSKRKISLLIKCYSQSARGRNKLRATVMHWARERPLYNIFSARRPKSIMRAKFKGA